MKAIRLVCSPGVMMKKVGPAVCRRHCDGNGDKYHVRWLEIQEYDEKTPLDDQVLGIYILCGQTNSKIYIPW